MSPGSTKPGSAASATLAARPMPGLEHAAAPHRDPVGGADVVDAAGLEVAADPPRLDVDDRAGAERDRVGRGPRGRRSTRRGRPASAAAWRARRGRATSSSGSGCSIRSRSKSSSRARCRASASGTRCWRRPAAALVAEALADRAHRLDVPAGLDLQLDPQVALGEVAVDGVEQLPAPSPDADARPPRAPGRRPRRGTSARDSPAARSSASRTAASRAAFAIGWPLTASSRRGRAA